VHTCVLCRRGYISPANLKQALDAATSAFQGAFQQVTKVLAQRWLPEYGGAAACHLIVPASALLCPGGGLAVQLSGLGVVSFFLFQASRRSWPCSYFMAALLHAALPSYSQLSASISLLPSS
jgi:hypothetical protein